MKHVWFLFVLLHISCYSQERGLPSFAKGVYGDPQAFLKNGMTFESLGVNALFVRSVSLTDDLFSAAKKSGVRVYMEFPTLNGKDYVEQHPEAWPINEKGLRAPAADWFMGVCLTDTGFYMHREKELRTLLTKYAVNGVWLDYVHWHAQFETPEPILPETCFCARCVSRFETEAAINIPSGTLSERADWILTRADAKWRAWRAGVLNGWVQRMKAVTHELRPDALLGVYYCPWFPGDFNAAQYRVLGLDLSALSKIADVLSPMLYHEMMGRTVEWVGEYVQWLQSSGITEGNAPKVWPIVQAHNKAGVVTTADFRHVMWNGSRPPASGIMMFTLHTLLSEPGKMDVMKDLYRKR